MNVLNLRNPEKKEISIILCQKESNYLLEQNRINLCEDILVNLSFTFVTVDMEGASVENFNPKSLVWNLGTCSVPGFGIDMPKFARSYIEQEIDDLKEEVASLEQEYEKLDPNSFKAQNLASWIDTLKIDIDEKRNELEKVIRPKWIASRILEIATNFEEHEINVMHISPANLIKPLTAVLNEVQGLNVSVFDVKEKVILPVPRTL
ncbi:MAG: hypothetical protein ACTSWN_10395 [Promethearchaeota archaeon]